MPQHSETPAGGTVPLTRGEGSWEQVSLALPSVQEAWGPGYTYLAFCGIAVVAVASIYATVPETKGRSLEEIEAMFGSQLPSPAEAEGKVS